MSVSLTKHLLTQNAVLANVCLALLQCKSSLRVFASHWNEPPCEAPGAPAMHR